MARDRVQMVIRLPPSERDALKVAAERDRRTTQSLVEKIISDWLAANQVAAPE